MEGIKFGVIVGSRNLEESFNKVKLFNLSICQISFFAEDIDNFDPYKVKKLQKKME